eukprot:1147759-Pelagomonas_calceolata.AAC.2
MLVPVCVLTEGQAAERVQRQCLQLRSEMSHFVTNLQYYLMFEVMESAWQPIAICRLLSCPPHCLSTNMPYRHVQLTACFPWLVAHCRWHHLPWGLLGERAEMSRRVSCAADLDQLIDAHEDYLGTLIRKPRTFGSWTKSACGKKPKTWDGCSRVFACAPVAKPMQRPLPGRVASFADLAKYVPQQFEAVE